MYPKPILQLIEYFTRLPGVGPRAAGRFVFSLLKENPSFVKEFGEALSVLPSAVTTCENCFRTIEQKKSANGRCVFCSDKNRNSSIVMVIEKESDLAAAEKSGAYRGLYHVLGGTLSMLDNESPKKLKIKELYARLAEAKKTRPELEVILATNPTPEGDVTANYIERVLEPLSIQMTRLGRGITSGSELEYIDEITMQNALKNRK